MTPKDLSNPNSHYMLIFRGNDWHRGLSAEEMQKVASDWMSWFHGLMAEGKALAGNPLEPESKVVSGVGGRVVADGPFNEAKEEVAGYFLLLVKGMDEAVAIAQRCPGLPHGIRVEVRPVAGECPLIEKVRTETQSHSPSQLVPA